MISDQSKFERRICRLLQSAVFAFGFAKDASLLNEGDDRLLSMRRTIVQLMDQLIECSVFMREYARTTFLGERTLKFRVAQSVIKLIVIIRTFALAGIGRPEDKPY